MRAGPLLVATTSAVQHEAVPGIYAAAVVLQQLENAPSPGPLLRAVHAALQPGAPLLLTVSNGAWCFDENTIQLLLLRYGFHEVLVRKPDAAGMLVTAAKCDPPARPKCSIIVAAFNEKPTFPVLMDALLNKTIPGVDREIIVVESNSTDGTRELAQQYQIITPRSNWCSRTARAGKATPSARDSAGYRRHRADPGCRPRVRSRRL